MEFFQSSLDGKGREKEAAATILVINYTKFCSNCFIYTYIYILYIYIYVNDTDNKF